MMFDVGFVLFVIATLVAYFLHHYYKPSSHSDSQKKSKLTSQKRKSVCLQAKEKGRDAKDLARRQSTISSEDFECFHDVYTSFGELSFAMRQVGVHKARIIIGIDFTASNEWQGRRTFHKNSLHKLNPVRANPYQKIVQILGRILEPFTEPNCVYTYGFGDSVSQDVAVFNLLEDEDSPCLDFKQVLSQYNIVAKKVSLSGPTSFAPLIRKAIQLVIQSNNKYHMLFVLADGQMEDADPTLEALVDASNYPLSIVMIGVGDGPWGLMEDCDDLLPSRKFDNFQFVNFHESHQHRVDPDGNFALAALMEIPNQFAAMTDLGYFSTKNNNDSPI